MDIVRKIYCEGHYEGAYQLIKKGEDYVWSFLVGTTDVNYAKEIDCPCINVERGRTGEEIFSETYLLPSIILFKPEDLVTV